MMNKTAGMPSKLSILLVEDSEDDYIIANRLLEKAFDEDNFSLVWEKTYDGAIEAVKCVSFDILLIDVNLGGRDGLLLTKDLDPHNDETPPIIILTGGDDTELELDAIRLGASDCLFKNQLTGPLLERVITYSIIKKQTQSELLEKEMRFRAILETANDGIITLDDDGVITSYNFAAKKLFGYSVEEVIGKNISMLMPKKLSDKHDAYLAQYLATSIEVIIGNGREVRGLKKDGTEFPLYLSVADVGIPGPNRFSGILRDLTLEKEARLQHSAKLEKEVLLRTADFQKEKEKAEKADNAKSEFLANISHEIRTPLYGILSFANMGIDRALTSPAEKSKEYFGHIKESGDRLLGLLNDLLDLSKLELSKNSMSFESENIKVIAEQCLQSEKARLNEKKITWSLKADTMSTMAQCNNDGIRQVISNLLSNAIHFSSASAHIDISITSDEHYLQFRMSDEGVGIPEDEMKIIFDKFIQSSKTNTGAGGTGLGLSICKEIIKVHKGKIWAENGEKTGASFIFEIPVVNKTNGE